MTTSPHVADPFKIHGPAVISFSGGRTSALMLRRCLDAGLDDDVHVCFANTGKEREETLEFVHEIEKRWGVVVRWLERPTDPEDVAGFRIVSFETASRQGEPFAKLISDRKFPPNPVTRFCTTELKIRVMKRFMLSLGHGHWVNVVGLRADEPGRVASMRDKEGKERWSVEMPLADAGIRLADVDAFWKRQPFGLALKSWEGNCDLCMLKGRAKKERIIRDRPDLPGWWIEQEVRTKATFRASGPTYAQLVELAARPMLFADDELDGIDDLGDCVCSGAA